MCIHQGTRSVTPAAVQLYVLPVLQHLCSQRASRFILTHKPTHKHLHAEEPQDSPSQELRLFTKNALQPYVLKQQPLQMYARIYVKYSRDCCFCLAVNIQFKYL